MSASRSPKRRRESSSKLGSNSSRFRSPVVARKKPVSRSSKNTKGSSRRRLIPSRSPSQGTSRRRQSSSDSRSLGRRRDSRLKSRRFNSSRFRSPDAARKKPVSPSSKESKGPARRHSIASRSSSKGTSRQPHDKPKKDLIPWFKRSGSPSFKHNRRNDSKPSKCLAVFGLSVTTSSQDLKRIFEKYGSIKLVNLIEDSSSTRYFPSLLRTFAFITFHNIGDACKAVRDFGMRKNIDHKDIRVHFSIDKRQRRSDDYDKKDYDRHRSPYYKRRSSPGGSRRPSYDRRRLR